MHNTSTKLKFKILLASSLMLLSILIFVSSATISTQLDTQPTKIIKQPSPEINPDTISSAGTVYVAFTIDTEPRNPSTTIYNQTLNLQDYMQGGIVDQLINQSFRNQFLDSTGHPIVFSWFLLSQQLECSSTAQDCSAINAAMEPYKERASALGDIYGWHYHHSDWTDINQDGTHYWNQLQTFDGTEYGHGTDIEVAERIVAQLIFDKGVYPGTFRTGWTWENTNISNWLDNITPFDFSNLAPLKSEPADPPPTKNAAGSEPQFNIFDWSRAPTEWTYYHPSASDYQSQGNLKRYLFRSSNDPDEWNKAFTAAENGQDQLVVLFLHSYNPKTLYIEYLNYMQNVASDHPNIQFRYVTALEGAQKMAFSKITSPSPTSSISQNGSIITINSNEPLFTFPYGALKINGDYKRVYPTNKIPEISNGNYSWIYDLTEYVNSSENVEFRIGGIDPYGRSFVTDIVTF